MTNENELLRLSRPFAVSPEAAFDAWLTPAQVSAWLPVPAKVMAGMQDEIVRIAIDARVGGAFSFLVRRGGQEIDHVGEYLELDRPRRLVFTWGVAGYPGASTVRLDFVPEGTGTKVEVAVSGVAPEYREKTAQGWSAILGAIAGSLV